MCSETIDMDTLAEVTGGAKKPKPHPTMVTDCWHLTERAQDYARWDDRRAARYQRAADQCWATYRKIPKKF